METRATGAAMVTAERGDAFSIRYLDAWRSMGWVREYKRRSFSYLEAGEGQEILDLGCGVGQDALALAEIVGPQGRVVGIDHQEGLIAEARRRAAGRGLPVEYRTGDVHQLDFADGTFDGCRTDQVLQHVADLPAVVGEMVRVIRPGGRLVACEPDWGTLVIDAEDREVTRALVASYGDGVRNGWVGRRLPGLFRASGLVDVRVHPDTWVVPHLFMAREIWQLEGLVERNREAGVITAEAGRAWLAGLDEADRQGRFFAAVTGFAVAGRKPG